LTPAATGAMLVGVLRVDPGQQVRQMSDIKVRKYRKRDRDAVLRITEGSFEGLCLDSVMERHFGPIAGTSWQDRKRGGIEWDLRHRPEHVLVAEEEGEVVGYMCTRLYYDHCIGHVANMAVAREYQGKGVGKMLMQAALDYFRQCGMRYARIETLEENYKGQNFYPSFGFKEVGRQIYYFREL
jgi:GNAT superfamily N-acetyltransferase